MNTNKMKNTYINKDVKNYLFKKERQACPLQTYVANSNFSLNLQLLVLLCLDFVDRLTEKMSSDNWLLEIVLV